MTIMNPPSHFSRSHLGDQRIDLDRLVEQIWQHLKGQTPRPHIHQVATEVAATFESATVATFVPILIHRYTLEKLTQTTTEAEEEV